MSKIEKSEYTEGTLVAYKYGDSIALGKYLGIEDGYHIVYPVTLQTNYQPVLCKTCSKVILPKGALDESSGSASNP